MKQFAKCAVLQNPSMRHDNDAVGPGDRRNPVCHHHHGPVTCRLSERNQDLALVDRIQGARDDVVDFIIINAGALTHTSVALRDALAALAIPFIEVHLSNVYRREEFRHRSYLADLAVGVVAGLGARGYRYALLFALDQDPR